MINSKKLYKIFSKNSISFFTGVPDSVLKYFTNFIEDLKINNHIIATNEGSAVALGIGYYLSKKKIPCIYMQNSGLGNAINPLISIAHKKVYSIPLILLIGWRGDPIKNDDEPQHNLKGKITTKILKLLDIPYKVIDTEKDLNKVNEIINYSKKNKCAVAILIKRNKFQKVNSKKIKKKNKKINRAFFIKNLLQSIDSNTKIVATTGYTSRELFQLRKLNNIKKGKDFYMIGGMGHSAIVSAGVAINSKNNVICLDGDGSILMHLGSLSTIAKLNNKKFKHILFNNNCHESVGGQSTYSESINFELLTKSMGYKNFRKIDNIINLKKKIKDFLKLKGPSFLEIKTSLGSLENLKRPKELLQIRNRFIK